MKHVAKLAAWVMGIALAIGIASTVTDAKLLTPGPLLQSIPSQAYSELAASFPTAIDKSSRLPSSDTSLISQSVSATSIKQIISQTVTGGLGYLHGGSVPPSLNLQPLLASLNQAGVATPHQLASYLRQPQTVKAGTSPVSLIRTVVRLTDLLRWYAPLIALIMAVLIVLTGHKHRLHYLAKGLFIAAVGLGLLCLWDYVIPSVVGLGLASTPLSSIATPIKAALSSNLKSANHIYEVVICVFLLAGLVLEVTQALLHHLHRKAHD